MDEQVLVATRLALHRVAELLLAGPQYAATSDIRLRVAPGGFGTVREPHRRVDGHLLVAWDQRLPIEGTPAELATAIGIEVRSLRDVYQGGPEFDAHEALHVDPQAARLIADSFARADQALRSFAPHEDPVLWPEHFDVGVTVDEVNYGVSPGDDHLPEPYAYVGPWQVPSGEFWNAPFGAARPLTQLQDITAFFREGRERQS